MDTAEKQELLKREILADAEKRAQAVVRRAERDADKAKEEAADQAAAEKREALAKAESAAAHAASRTMATVPIEKARRRAHAQEEAIQRAIDAATGGVADLEGKERIAVLVRLLVDAAKRLDEPELLVQAGAADQQALPEVCAEAQTQLAAEGLSVTFHVDESPASMNAGIVARTLDGHRIVDHSQEARRKRLGPQLRSALARLLFPQADGTGECKSDE